MDNITAQAAKRLSVVVQHEYDAGNWNVADRLADALEWIVDTDGGHSATKLDASRRGLMAEE